MMWMLASPSTEFMKEHFLVSWTALMDGRYWTLLTSVFSHNMFFHIFLNMFVLLSFGPPLESRLGTRRFVMFYIVAGLISSFAHAAVSEFLLGQPGLPALGASGSIAGVITVFAFIFPRAKILVMGIIPVPALMGVLLLIGIDLWGLMSQMQGSGLPIGHGAHLGGAFTGVLYYVWLRIR